jgi:hypothetical protein
VIYRNSNHRLIVVLFSSRQRNTIDSTHQQQTPPSTAPHTHRNKRAAATPILVSYLPVLWPVIDAKERLTAGEKNCTLVGGRFTVGVLFAKVQKLLM